MSISFFSSTALAVKTSPTRDNIIMTKNVLMVCPYGINGSGSAQRLANLSNRVQLFLSIDKVRVDSKSGFEFLFRFSVQSSLNHHFTELVVSHIVIRTDVEALAIESNRLLAVAAGLSLLEVFAKRAIAVPRFLILNLLPRQKIVDFLALPGELYFLSSKLFRLFFQNFRIATGKQARDK